MVSLQPPWFQVFPEDNVTLSCQGAHSPGDSSTQWVHNGTAIPTQVQPSYSFKASSNHSGDYRCQTGQTSLSDPVHLDVTSGQWRSWEAWEADLRAAGPAEGLGTGWPFSGKCGPSCWKWFLSSHFPSHPRLLRFYVSSSEYVRLLGLSPD